MSLSFLGRVGTRRSSKRHMSALIGVMVYKHCASWRKNEICFCIGETTAEALKGVTKNIVLPEIPSTELLIEEVIQQFNLDIN